MKKAKRIPLGVPAILASVLALSCSAVWAARSFTPQAGTWVVSEELDGKPGRGLAIDVQGNTFFMQVFGYEKNGDATFYTATAQMDGTTATAPLMRYKAGRSFGSSAQDAVEDGSPGMVNVSFSNGILGSIRFPGEEEKRIERFLINDPDFDDAVMTPRPNMLNIGKASQWLIFDQDENFVDLLLVTLKRGEGKNYQLSMGSRSARSPSTYDCQRLSGPQSFSCQATAAQGEVGPYPELKFRLVGPEVVGEFRNSSGNTLEIVGVQRAMGFVGGAVSLCGLYDYAYMPTGCDQWNMPANGTWVFSDELTGKPGRGISVDMQDKVAILQIFNYRPDGRATFHMGSAVIGFNPVTGTANWGEIPIQRYQGGRYFGGPSAAAVPVHNANDVGDAVMEFTRRSEDGDTRYIEGTLKLPDQDAKPLKRLDMQGMTLLSRFGGQWVMTFVNATPIGAPITRTVRFSSASETSAISDDGLVQCAKDVEEFQPYACNLYVDATRTVVLGTLRGVFNGFTADPEAIQWKDQFGNRRGVGKIASE